MIQEQLSLIQKELKAPKNQYNSFGKYNYRSCEDILEAVKPLLGDSVLVLNDEIIIIGNRYYVKATATLRIGEESLSINAYAREEEDKKGMDAAQITGACSSYARKYALNGLFLIDDTKDADTRDNTKDKKPDQQKSSTPTTPAGSDLPSGDCYDVVICVKEIESVPGVNKTTNKPWEKFIIIATEATGGDKYATFDKKFAQVARDASEKSTAIVIKYHTNKFGNQIDDLIHEGNVDQGNTILSIVKEYDKGMAVKCVPLSGGKLRPKTDCEGCAAKNNCPAWTIAA